MTESDMITELHQIVFDCVVPVVECELPGDGEHEKLMDITLGDIVRSYRDNLWDDEHDGGAHKQHLYDVRDVMVWMGFDPIDIDELSTIDVLEDDELRP